MKPDAGEQTQALRRRIAAHIAPYRAMLLAFSGGLDSTVLLDALTARRDGDEAPGGDGAPALTLRAVHVHHGLSRHADRWAAHCAHECRRRGIAFSTVRVVLNDTSEGVEAAARGARYRALTAALADEEVLLTAQHLDDQAETLLLALKRGSGPAGLAAMAADAPFRSHRLVRPLLACSRAQLEAYARERRLRWIDDDSNADLRFDRNFLRLRILPLLRQRWPRFADAVARSAQLCAEQERLLDELLEETLATLTQQDGSLRLTALTAMSDVRRAAILRRWLASRGARMPSRQQLACLWQEVALSRRDAVAQMQLDDWQVRRFRDRLYVLPRLPTLSGGEAVLPWPPESVRLTLLAGLGALHRRPVDAGSPAPNSVSGAAAPVAIVRAPLPDERVSVRFGPVRGLLYITGRSHGRTLKKIWQELDIPPWQRGSTPLLFYNDALIAALGVFLTWEGKAREHQAQWHLFWQRGTADAMTAAQSDEGQDGVLSSDDRGSN